VGEGAVGRVKSLNVKITNDFMFKKGRQKKLMGGGAGGVTVNGVGEGRMSTDTNRR